VRGCRFVAEPISLRARLSICGGTNQSACEAVDLWRNQSVCVRGCRFVAEPISLRARLSIRGDSWRFLETLIQCRKGRALDHRPRLSSGLNGKFNFQFAAREESRSDDMTSLHHPCINRAPCLHYLMTHCRHTHASTNPPALPGPCPHQLVTLAFAFSPADMLNPQAQASGNPTRRCRHLSGI
jgi:hypothetical protein